MSKPENWVWMPHAGHLIISGKCKFHLNTYVGGYIVSTVGEWWPERLSRDIHAEIYDPEWFVKNRHLKGDIYDAAYFKKFGYEEIGYHRTYETMVFKAAREKQPDALCCPWTMESAESVDFNGYNDAVSARKGHLALCKQWGQS